MSFQQPIRASDQGTRGPCSTSHPAGNWSSTSSGEPVRVDVVTPPRRAFELPGTIPLAELKRRLWHVSPGLFPVVSYIYPHKDPLSPTFQAIAFGVMLCVTGALLWRYHTIRRANETSNLGAVFGYAWATVGTLLLFPKHAELGMLVLVVLAFGDGMATTCGMLFRGPTLPWNPDKTWSGTLAFIGFGGYLSSLAYWAEAQPTASWSVALVCGFTAAVVAALAESIQSRINDNVRVGLTAATTAVATHAWMVGL